MPKIAIITDSTAAYPENRITENVRTIPLKVCWEDDSYDDGVDITPAEFYERLVSTSVIPTTSQPPVEEFLRVYKELAVDYEGIIVLLISSGISGTVSSAESAATMFSEIPVEVVDSLSTSAGLALIVSAVQQAVENGDSLEEVARLARETAANLKIYFAVDTLEFLHKGGRIGGASRYLGTALGIKPILTFDEQGEIDALERVRTKKKAIKKLVEVAVEKADGKPVYIGLTHANALEDVKKLRDLLVRELDCREIIINELSPVLGTHVGPGTIGVGIIST
jgi:DegV family protein with EDD domain